MQGGKGGKREGAGRKVDPADRKITTTIRLKSHLLDWLISLKINRSEYINGLIETDKNQRMAKDDTDTQQ